MFPPKIRRVSRCGDEIDIFETKTAQEIDVWRTERDNVVYWKTKGKINNDLHENILFTVFQFDFEELGHTLLIEPIRSREKVFSKTGSSGFAVTSLRCENQA